MMRFLWSILKLLRSKESLAISKTRRITTYCRLCVKHALVRLSIITPTKERLFGYSVALGDYASFVVSYEEIFMSMDYYFVSSTPAPLIIDAGSNIGMAALFFTVLYPQSKIICFEPSQSSYSCLQENITRNRFANVTAHRYALDAAPHREIQLLSTVRTSLMASVGRAREGEDMLAERVRTTTLSSYIQEPIELLKLDVEGNEHVVAEDLGAHSKWQSVRQAIIEYHHHMVVGDDRLAQFLAQLEEAGFRYQIHSTFRPPFLKDRFQNILIFAYR